MKENEIPFDRRHYTIQPAMECCKNCMYSENGGFPSNPLQCEYPTELRQAIEHGIRIIVDPLGICDGYYPEKQKCPYVDFQDVNNFDMEKCIHVEKCPVRKLSNFDRIDCKNLFGRQHKAVIKELYR